MRIILYFFLSKLRLNKIPWDVDSFFNIDGPPLDHLAVVGLQPSLLAQPLDLLCGEEVAPGAVLAGVEVLGYFRAGFEPDLRHVVQAVVTKQQDSARC